MYRQVKLLFNKYDFYIIILISCLVFGNFGGMFQIIRIVSLFAFPYVLKNKRKLIGLFPVRTVNNFFIFWILYSSVSLLWTPNIIEGIKSVFYLSIHFNLFFLLALLSFNAKSPLLSITCGWFSMICLSLPVAIWEFVTDNHLYLMNENQVNDQMLVEGMALKKKNASVTFGNINGYVFILSMALIFVWSAVYSVIVKKLQKCFIIVIFIASIVLLINGSRGGILVYLMSLILLILLKAKKSAFSIISIVVPILFLGYYLSIEYDIFMVLRYRLETGTESNNIRKILINESLYMFFNTLGFGTGAASMNYLGIGKNIGIDAFHNQFLEVIVQYGVFVFVGFLYFLYRPIKRLLRISSPYQQYLGLIVLITIIPLSVIDSGYLLSPTLWIFYSSLYILAYNRYDYKSN